MTVQSSDQSQFIDIISDTLVPYLSDTSSLVVGQKLCYKMWRVTRYSNQYLEYVPTTRMSENQNNTEATVSRQSKGRRYNRANDNIELREQVNNDLIIYLLYPWISLLWPFQCWIEK